MNKDLSDARKDIWLAIAAARNGGVIEQRKPTAAAQLAQRKRDAATHLERRAIRKGSSWTAKDDEIVRSDELTALDKAELLGRTLSAVNSRRKRLRWW